MTSPTLSSSLDGYDDLEVLKRYFEETGRYAAGMLPGAWINVGHLEGCNWHIDGRVDVVIKARYGDRTARQVMNVSLNDIRANFDSLAKLVVDRLIYRWRAALRDVDPTTVPPFLRSPTYDPGRELLLALQCPVKEAEPC